MAAAAAAVAALKGNKSSQKGLEKGPERRGIDPLQKKKEKKNHFLLGRTL